MPGGSGTATWGRGGRGGGGFRQRDPIDLADNTGWTSMFDGSSLRGWDGNMALWHVENGAITVESTCEKPTGTVYLDRKSTRLNSSHLVISYAVFCLKKKQPYRYFRRSAHRPASLVSPPTYAGQTIDETRFWTG